MKPCMIYGARQRRGVPDYCIDMSVAYTNTCIDFISHIFVDAEVTTSKPSLTKLNDELWKTIGKSMKDHNNTHSGYNREEQSEDSS